MLTYWLRFVRWTLRGTEFDVLSREERFALMDAGAETERAVVQLMRLCGDPRRAPSKQETRH